MSPKGILIAFAIVSLLLIGMMFLVVDVRNNPVTESKSITNTTQEASKRNQTLQDSLNTKVSSKDTNEYPKFAETLNRTTENVLSVINSIKEELFPGGLAAHDLKKSDRVAENNAVFFKQDGNYSKQAKQLVGTLNTFEHTIRSLQKKVPALKNIQPEVRNAYSGNT
ncbi:MAG: hypothetical protein AAF617_12600, partial [Bacteroidota bacterium]